MPLSAFNEYTKKLIKSIVMCCSVCYTVYTDKDSKGVKTMIKDIKLSDKDINIDKLVDELDEDIQIYDYAIQVERFGDVLTFTYGYDKYELVCMAYSAELSEPITGKTILVAVHDNSVAFESELSLSILNFIINN